MSNVNKKVSPIEKEPKTNNKLIKNINSNIKQVTPEEFKFFFKRYLRNKNSNKLTNESETDSTLGEMPESSYELNTIYLSNLNNLNNFLQKTNNLRGITLKGNKLLENVSLIKFNSFFREYGKNIERQLKKHVLKFFYPNNNKPKLMGQKMNLTPIPVKRNIYLKNEKEKKDLKNAERAAVILRRLEYTHGLGEKKNKDDKILFYLMKGAALIIEDWWIRIIEERKKNEDYNTLISKIKNMQDDVKSNKKEIYTRKNRFAFKQKSNKKTSKEKEMKKNKNKKEKNGKLKKKNKIEIIEINLDEEQEQPKENKEKKIFKEYKDNQTEPRNSAPVNSNINISNLSTKNKAGNKIKNINQSNDNIKYKKVVSARNIFENKNVYEKKHNLNKSKKNEYELKIDKNKEKKIKPNPIKLIKSKSAIIEKDDKDEKSINNINNRVTLNKDSNNDNKNIPISNGLNNLIINKKIENNKSSSTKKYNGSDYKNNKKETNNTKIKNMNNNKLFDNINIISKSPNNVKINAKYVPNIKDKPKSQNCKVKSQPKIKIKSEDVSIRSSRSKKKDENKDKAELVIENNINLLIGNEDYNKEKRNKEINLNCILNENTFKDITFANKDIKIDSIDLNDSNKNVKENNQNIDNNKSIIKNLKHNKSINVVSVIGYKLKDDENNKNNLFNSENIINHKKIDNINNDNNEKKENNDININQEEKDFSKNNINNNIIKENIINNQNEIGIKIDDNNAQKSSNNENIKEIEEINNDNNVLIHINESNKDKESKEKINLEEINNNLINNSSSLNKEKNNINNQEENINNSKDNEEGSFKFNKNSFFFNNSNNVLLVNIDNNSDYDETEIKKINLKKNYYYKYTTNIIKININNTDYNIYNKKKEKKEKCLTDKNDLNKKEKSKSSEDILDYNNIPKSSRQEKGSTQIKYKIIPNINIKNKPNYPAEKTSFDGSVDEIISNHLIKIHNNNNELYKKRIEKAYNNAQLRKSQNYNNRIYNNFDLIDFESNTEKGKMKKSRSSEKFIIKKDLELNKE